MWLLNLAWKNLWRNKQRTLITMAAVFFAVILTTVVSSLQKGVFQNLIQNLVSFYSGYIQVHKKGYWNEQILENTFRQDAETERKIRTDPLITGIAPRLESFALAASIELTKGCLVVGMVPEEENKVTRLREKLVNGNYLQPEDESVLISEGLSRRLKLRLGDTLVLIGQGYHGATAAGKFPVKGILRFGSPELNNKTVFLPLRATQTLYSAENQLSSYVLSVSNPDNLDKITERVRYLIGDQYEVMKWEEMMPDIKQHIRTDTASMSIIAGVLYILVCFGIFGTLLMMMVERRFELGMLVAVGMKKIWLCLLMLAESVFTVLSGCVLGILASVPLVIYLKVNPITFSGKMAEIYERFGFEPIFPASTDPEIFLNQALIILLLALLLSLSPVVKVLQLDPVQAMKQ